MRRVADRRVKIFSERCSHQRERSRGEPRLHHRLLVGERQFDQVVDETAERCPRVAHDADPAAAAAGLPKTAEQLEHLGRGSGPRDRDDRVVVTVHERLGCGECVGLTLAGGLAQRRVGLRHEPGGAAPDHGDALAGSGEERLFLPEFRGTRPRLGLRAELLVHVGSEGGCVGHDGVSCPVVLSTIQ